MGRKLSNSAIGSNKINNKDSQKFPFDSIDINIIRELLAKADIKSVDIASKYKVPISTIQRRRKKACGLDIRKEISHRHNEKRFENWNYFGKCRKRKG